MLIHRLVLRQQQHHGRLLRFVQQQKQSYSSSRVVATKDLDLVRGLETVCLHGGYLPDPTTHARGVPVYRTAPYVFESTEKAAALFALQELGNVYTRIMNPTNDVLEQRFAQMQGGAAGLCMASGTAAIFNTVINLAEAGDSIVSANNLYGGTYTQFHDLLPKLGITTTFVDICDLDRVREAVHHKNKNVKALFCETVSNPALEIAPLQELGEIAKEANIPLVVDDTFTTPYLTRPLDWGADIICHSLTKWSGGHGTGIGGIVVDSGRFPWSDSGKHPLYTEPDTSYNGLRWGLDLPEALAPIAFLLRLRTVPLRNLGSCLSPDNSWMFLQGIETLPLRMERHCENAAKVADFLVGHAGVASVRYPGLPDDTEYEKNVKYLGGKGGPLVVFELEQGAEAGRRFIDALKLHSHVANVGDAKSLAIHPATTTHSQLSPEQQLAGGITPGLVRLAVGIESIDDILEDLDQALAKAVEG